MGRQARYLSSEQAAAVYDRIGRFQDAQAFYENAAVDALVREGRFDQATRVVEIGCGTGALAARLLARHLPPTSNYLGLDVSPRMVALSRSRLRPWAERAESRLVDGRSPWPVPDASCDRVIAVYVLDLLSPDAIDGFFGEARRVLDPGGLVAVTSLAPATTGAARLVSNAWTRLWRFNPQLTGGCRPIELTAVLPTGWRVEHAETIVRYGITSQMLVATSKPSPEPGHAAQSAP